MMHGNCDEPHNAIDTPLTDCSTTLCSQNTTKSCIAIFKPAVQHTYLKTKAFGSKNEEFLAVIDAKMILTVKSKPV